GRLRRIELSRGDRGGAGADGEGAEGGCGAIGKCKLRSPGRWITSPGDDRTPCRFFPDIRSSLRNAVSSLTAARRNNAYARPTIRPETEQEAVVGPRRLYRLHGQRFRHSQRLPTRRGVREFRHLRGVPGRDRK